MPRYVYTVEQECTHIQFFGTLKKALDHVNRYNDLKIRSNRFKAVIKASLPNAQYEVDGLCFVRLTTMEDNSDDFFIQRNLVN